MAGERITQAEFARRHGWSKQYVAKLVKQGRITLEGGKVDALTAKKAIDQLSEPSMSLREQAGQRHTGALIPASGSSSSTEGRKAVDYAAARTMREAYRAKMARLDFEEREGKLIDAAKVREDAFRVGRMIRDALLGIPDRMADVLAAEDNAIRVKQLLHQDIEEALQSLSDDGCS
ncbi:hypothetical protein [Parendozoicomonas sp. Alg238-R29]|uniref:hypothetical protein n=1 Tax=Parendozoicomonas sp. Alg238-R29 TaxID=2993446 RepID=UPI00248D482F|nr:hypothetical protein [Parendozoicomonas sp. Alg238-R29]